MHGDAATGAELQPQWPITFNAVDIDNLAALQDTDVAGLADRQPHCFEPDGIRLAGSPGRIRSSVPDAHPRWASGVSIVVVSVRT